MTPGMKALVTGAYGFVGRYVAKSLATSGYEVRAIGHGAWSRDEWREWGISDWRLTDVNMEALVTYGGEPDVIFHCAGSGSVAFSMTHPHQDYQRTVTTTHAVLEYIRTVQPQTRLVVPSSAGVYGVAQSLPIAVNDTLRPASPYGAHKKIAEDLCRVYGNHFGVRTAIVRLFSIYGRGLRKQLLWDACGKLRAGDATFGGTGQETRDWLHVTDAAALMLAGARHASTECPVVNGGTGEATAVSTIVEVIADCLGGHGRPRFSGLSRPGDPTDYQADITEARSWGWAPTQTWRDGIRDYVQWFEEGAQ